jgi:endonuclease/exonuclease/phosphatase (EEP) superfamily protein YafD
MGIIISELSKLNKPVIIAGDFNDTRNSKAMKLLASEFYVFPKGGNASTFPADKPKSEIDFIALYTGKGAKATVKNHTVLNCPVESDHRPIFAKVLVEW